MTMDGQWTPLDERPPVCLQCHTSLPLYQQPISRTLTVPHELTPVPAACLTHPHDATRAYPYTPSENQCLITNMHTSFPVVCQIMAMRQPGFSLPGGASDGRTPAFNNRAATRTDGRAASAWCWNCGKNDHLFEACPETTKAAAPRAAWNTPGGNLAAQGPYWRGHQSVPMSPAAAVQAGKEALAQWFGSNMHDEAGRIRLSWSNSALNVV